MKNALCMPKAVHRRCLCAQVISLEPSIEIPMTGTFPAIQDLVLIIEEQQVLEGSARG
jgi:hypothetical protein